ncbi:MAG: ATP-binding cassette domain-containing protein [Rhodopila sp.]|nr:ATP-binding cassette domain-containing protein [Rhodopila sp.]
MASAEQRGTVETVESDPGSAAIATLRRQAIWGGLGVAAISFACNVGALAVPIYNMEVFNRVMTTHNMRTLVGLSVGLAISVTLYVILDHLRVAAMTALGDRFARSISPALLRAVSIAGMRASNPMQAIRDAETLRQFIASPTLTAPFDLLWCPVLLLVLLAMGWGYALLAAAFVVILAGLSLLGNAVTRRPMMEANEASVNGFRDVAGATRGAEAVIAMGMLPTLARRWERAQNEALSAGTRGLLRSRSVAAMTHALRSAMTGAMVATGLVLVLNGYASSGSLVAVNMILARMLMPFEHFAGTLRQWADAASAWRRVRMVLREGVPARYTYPLPRPEGHLVVERLVFMPPGADRPILRGISFQVAPGEIIGIIGPSASGKSTLMKLLLGAAEPTSGGVFLDGHNTYLWNREDFARHVGYVPQSAVLTDGTVAENIARGGEPDLDAVIAAARRAGVHAAIAALPYGYATRIAGSGLVLSAGQRQRVALARALYGSPRLLILDEPNAFLDNDGEAMLDGLLTRLRAEGTGVLISTHRPSVVRSVDKLLVLQHGAIEHFDTRESVMRAIGGPQIRLVRASGKAATS